MERAIEKAGCSYRAFDYPGTGHWFAEATRTDVGDKEREKTFRFKHVARLDVGRQCEARKLPELGQVSAHLFLASFNAGAGLFTVLPQARDGDFFAMAAAVGVLCLTAGVTVTRIKRHAT